MIAVEFIWDEGDASVGLWAGWEACYAVIEQGEGIRTLVSFEPMQDEPVHEWPIESVETQYYWTEPCSYCGGTGDRLYQGGERKGQPMGRCHPCKSTGMMERVQELAIEAKAKRWLSDLPPVALAVKREWDRITLLDEIRRYEEDASLASEYADSLSTRVEGGEATQAELDQACQDAEAARDQYKEARKRYESVYGDLEEAP